MKQFIKMVYISILAVIGICNIGCGQKHDIDSVITKYERADFSELNNSFIAIRQRNLVEVIYIVQKSEGNLPVYFVTYNVLTKDIKINRAALIRADTPDYFTEEQIRNLILAFRKYDMSLLNVDLEGNVFINPYESNSPAILLRLNKESNDKEIKRGDVFTHYEGRWYIKK